MIKKTGIVKYFYNSNSLNIFFEKSYNLISKLVFSPLNPIKCKDQRFSKKYFIKYFTELSKFTYDSINKISL